MIANLNDAITQVYGTYPETYNNVLNYPAATTHYVDGWRSVVYPTYDETTQYLGDIFFDVPNDYFTFQIINKTDEEIQAEKKAQTESEGIALAQQMSYNTLMIEQQAIEDPKTNLDNAAIFPFWDGNNVIYALGFKVQSFDANNDLWLYKCVQAHTSQSTYNPYLTPALWTKVTPDGQVYKWIQPISSVDSYMTNDRVWFPEVNDDIYKSVIDNNVWSPTAYPAGWVLDN